MTASRRRRQRRWRLLQTPFFLIFVCLQQHSHPRDILARANVRRCYHHDALVASSSNCRSCFCCCCLTLQKGVLAALVNTAVAGGVGVIAVVRDIDNDIKLTLWAFRVTGFPKQIAIRPKPKFTAPMWLGSLPCAASAHLRCFGLERKELQWRLQVRSRA